MPKKKIIGRISPKFIQVTAKSPGYRGDLNMKWIQPEL